MTREEAIKIIERVDICANAAETARDMAIAALKEPEIVHCKDCKYWKPGDSFGGDSLDDMQRIGRCPIVRFGRRENDFCCEGERKDNA